MCVEPVAEGGDCLVHPVNERVEVLHSCGWVDVIVDNNCGWMDTDGYKVG